MKMWKENLLFLFIKYIYYLEMDFSKEFDEYIK